MNGNAFHPDESQIEVDVLAAVTGTIAGAHREVAIELLLYWIYNASENRRTITRTILLQQLQRIGEYLAVLRDHASEWMVAVHPLEVSDLTAEVKEALKQEYRRGVQARWQHIIAGADCLRPIRLAELHEKLSRHSAVVVRGASGQGKSTLALRYLYDYYAEGLRFLVRFIDGRSHAMRIANVLRGHVDRLRLRAVVLIDLAPSDSGWFELVREMIDSGLKVIITVREEDFRRAGTFAPDVDYADVVLDSITREEAESIYDMLTSREHPASILDFEDAWSRFMTADAYPLLEFTHLVSEGETLAQKVGGQVDRLQREAAAGAFNSSLSSMHLQLLALASVANAMECRVNLVALCFAVGINPITNPLQVLEHEYLLCRRGTGSDTTVCGLHSLRSQAIEAALLRNCPELWESLAIRCLPLIVDEDIERFLLSAFSRRPQYSAKLQIALRDLPPRSWSHAGGIGRALLWEGLNRYEQENHETVSRAIMEHSNAWWIVCDTFLAYDSNFADVLRKNFEDILKKEIPKIQLTDKDRVFDPFRTWVENVGPPSTGRPATADDWILAGDLAYWLGNKKINVHLTKALHQLLPEPLPDYLSISELAQFISGRHALGDFAFIDWHDRHASELLQRFVSETKSVHVTDDGEEMRVFFPVILADDSPSPGHDTSDLHAQAIKRVQLLHELFPHRVRFGSQGLGVEMLGAFVPFDETNKTISAENLPARRAGQLTATFRNLVSYRLMRAASWRVYAETAFLFRRTVCDCFRDLQRAWGRFLGEAEIKNKTIRQMPVTGLDQIRASSNLPMFPVNAVDEWGFISEDQDRIANVEGVGSVLWGNLVRFKQWKKALRDYENGVGQVAQHTVEATMRHLAMKNLKQIGPIEPTSERLLIINLGSAWEALARMQHEFRRWLGRYVPSHRLQELEQHECSTFRHLWAVAFSFVYEPLELVSGGATFLERAMSSKRREFLANLREGLITVMSGIGAGRISEGPHSIGGKQCLLVVCDHKSLKSMEELRPKVVLAIWHAAHAVSWRDAEWTPLTIEWPAIFVTHVFRGKGLLSAGTHLSSYTLFATEADFQVQNYHLLDLPVQSGDYRRAGLEIWDTPLLSVALALQGGLFAFAITLMRFHPLVNLASAHGLSAAVLKPSLEAFSEEISTLRRSAQVAFEDLVGLMHIYSEVSGSGENILLDRLEELCNVWLFLDVASDDKTSLMITPDVFADWAARISEQMEEAKAVFCEIVESAVQNVL